METLSIKLMKFDPPIFEKSGKWIKVGTNDDFYDSLISLYKRNSTHSAIINAKVRSLVGNGWRVKNDNQQEQVRALIASRTWNLDSVFDRIAFDFVMFGGYALRVKKSNLGHEIVEHIPLNKFRISEDGKSGFIVDKKKKYDTIKIIEELPIYDKYNIQKDAIFYYHTPTAQELGQSDLVAMPSYIGALNYIEAGASISVFYLNEIKNGFSGGTIVMIKNGNYDNDQKRDIERKFKSKYTSESGEKLALIWSDGIGAEAEVINMTSSDADKRYEVLNKTIQQEIFIAHNVTSPMLLGVKTEGQLGGRTELKLAKEIWVQDYVIPTQKEIYQSANEVLQNSNYAFSVVFNEPAKIDDEVTIADFKEYFKDEELRQFASKKLNIPLLKMDGSVQLSEQSINLKFSEDEVIMLSYFEELGTTCEVLPEVSSHYINFQSAEEVENFEQEIYLQLAEDLTKQDEKVLSIIRNGRNVNAEEIAKALKVDEREIKRSLEILKTKGYIKVDGSNNYSTTNEGIRVDKTIKETNFEIVYKYSVLPFHGPSLLETSRPFCKALIGLAERGKVYTREEINLIGAKVDRDVWLYRGGFYSNPKTDVTTPSCRHIWRAIVLNKAK